jgi:hypothetical protein
MPVQAALRSATGVEVKRDGFLDTFTLYQAGSFALDVHEGTDDIDFTPILMSRSKAASLSDNAPTDDIAGSIEEVFSVGDGRSDVRDGVTDALLPPDAQRTFLNEMSRTAGRGTRIRSVEIDMS